MSHNQQSSRSFSRWTKSFSKVLLVAFSSTSHTGDNATELLIQSIKETLNWSIPEMHKRFCGGAFDGQYLKLNIPTHLAEKLSLKPDFTKDSTIWDVAHRVELACEDTKNGIKWLTDFDTTLQSIMKKFILGMHHTDVRNIPEELGETFLENFVCSATQDLLNTPIEPMITFI